MGALASPATFAFADDADEATKLFTEGRELFVANRKADALPYLERSFRLNNSPNTELIIAHILLDLGKPLEAYDRYRSVVAEAEVREKAGSKAYAASAESAKVALRSLEKKLAVIDVDAHAEAMIEVFRPDGQRLTLRRGGGRVVSPGGSVRVVVTRGQAREEKTLEVTEGERVVLSMTLQGASEVTPPIFGPWSIVGMSSASAGVALLAVSIGFGAKTEGHYSDLEHWNGSFEEADAVREEGKTSQVVTNATLTAGLILGAGGGTLIALDLLGVLRPEGGKAVGLTWSVELDPERASLGVSGTW